MSYGGSSGGGSIHSASDVALSSPLDTQVLAYDASTQKWKNLSVPAGGPLVVDALLLSGAAAIGNNVLPPGYRIPRAATFTALYALCGTAPSGSSLTLSVTRGASTLASLSISAGQTSASLLGQSIAVAAGDVLQFNITSIGSSGPGSDVAIQLIGS